MPLEKQLRDFLREHVGEDALSKRYVVAVSGGLDSMALFSVLCRCLPAENLVVGHFHHGVRGKAADDDASFVEAQAARRGAHFVLGRISGSGSSEEAMREQRLHFLKRIRVSSRADFILTAHHADDQLETFLMRILRGTGIDGLKGILPRNGTFLRPLLRVSRAGLSEYVSANRIPFREDETNGEENYFRNRIRHQAVPPLVRLADEFGGRERFLSRFSDSVADLQWASGHLQRQTLLRYRKSVVETPFWFRMSQSSWFGWDEPWRQRLLREVFARLGAPVPLRRRLRELAATLDSGVRSVDVPGAISVSRSCGHFFFQNRIHRDALKAGPTFSQSREGVALPGLGLRLEVEPKFLSGLEARFFRPGDRFQDKKLKVLFLESRIPRPERHLVPVLARRGSNQIEWYFPLLSRDVRVKKLRFPFSFIPVL